VYVYKIILIEEGIFPQLYMTALLDIWILSRMNYIYEWTVLFPLHAYKFSSC